MLRSIKVLPGYEVLATDGKVGVVHDFYFDDKDLVIRYLVIASGEWLSERKLLISPAALSQPDWEQKLFPLTITRDQVKDSPDINTDKPISRQQEIELLSYYQSLNYQTGNSLLAGPSPSPVSASNPAVLPELVSENQDLEADEAGDQHLRSVNEVLGYHIQARDGEIGHVEDFIVDDEGWAINYLIVDTQNWLPGRKVLVSPSWIEQVSWDEASVHVDLAQETIKNSPEYDPSTPVNQTYEKELYDYYGRPKG